MADELKNLAITNWYKAMLAVSGPAILVTLGTKTYSLALIATGVFVLGLGVWKSDWKVIEFGRAPGGIAKKTDFVHGLSWVGTPLEVLGAVITIYGLYRLFQFGP
jgi:hypothetical protein